MAAAFIERLTTRFVNRIRTSAAVVHVRRLAGGVLVEDAGGGTAVHDHVVIATHPDQAAPCSPTPASTSGVCWGRSPTRATGGAAPRSAADAAAPTGVVELELHRRERAGVRPHAAAMRHLWMNALQKLDPRVPLFVTLNPCCNPAPDLVEGTFWYDHPSYQRAALRAQRDLQVLQGQRRTWFCGSYFGAGFHEDALASGLAAAEALGGVRRP